MLPKAKWAKQLMNDASLGNLIECKLLFNNCTDINTKDRLGRTALVAATKNNQIEIVKLLLTHPEINVNCSNIDFGTPLTIASCRGYTEIVKLLLSRPKINVNAKDIDMWTAFMFASSNRQPGIAKLLIAHGAEVGIINGGLTAEIKEIYRNWKSYLPPFKRYALSNKYYPQEFKQWAFNFILCCIREKTFCKDLIYLLLEYAAEAWKKIK